MRLDVHVHRHGVGSAEVLAAISNLKETLMALSAKLQAAIDASNAELADAVTKLDATTTVLQNMVDIGAAATATALANAGVAEDQAAELVNSARVTLQEHVDKMFAVVSALPTAAEPAPPPADTAGGTGGADTIAAPEALAIVTTALPDAVAGQSYTASIEFAGGTAPYSVSSSPPSDNGVTVSAGGGVSGTPTEAIDSTFTVSVADSSDPVQTVSGAVVTLHTAAAPAEVIQQ